MYCTYNLGRIASEPVLDDSCCMRSAAESTAQMKRLESLACPTEGDVLLFNELMGVATQHRMNYREALNFVIRMRHCGYD